MLSELYQQHKQVDFDGSQLGLKLADLRSQCSRCIAILFGRHHLVLWCRFAGSLHIALCVMTDQVKDAGPQCMGNLVIPGSAAITFSHDASSAIVKTLA